MASFKETSVSRSTAPVGMPVRQPPSRNHSHSISLGAINANHRVTRRKSVSSRRGTEASSIGASSGFSSYLSRGLHAASPDNAAAAAAGSATATATATAAPAAAPRKTSPSSIDENTAVDGTGPVAKPVTTKSRNRRASEGSHLMRGEGRRVSTELRCDQCGKGYKHSSCLTKHMWEHDPAWAVTSKLLISKHQQVQLLEAATVLVAMNQDGPENESDNSSASPDASSEMHDGISSTETTPPPADDYDEATDLEKHQAAFSHSYQSVASSSFADNSPFSPAFSHFRHSSIDTRPSTAETMAGRHEDDDSDAADLAAAIRLCNFGTPRSSAQTMANDVPPVPPLPARYLSHGAGPKSVNGSSSLGLAGSNPAVFGSFNLDPSQSYKISDERDVKMGDADRESRHRRNNDVDFGSSRQTHDDDDDGVFGRMEE